VECVPWRRSGARGARIRRRGSSRIWLPSPRTPTRFRVPTAAPAMPLPSAPRGGSNLWGGCERGPPAGTSLGSGGRDNGPQAPRVALRWKWRRWLMASLCASEWEEEGDRAGMTRRSSGRGAERGFGERAIPRYFLLNRQ
jgi:hypothetical protein